MTTNATPQSIIGMYGAPKMEEKSLPHVTKKLDAYTQKNMRMKREEIVRITFFVSWNLLLKNSGSVIELPATCE